MNVQKLNVNPDQALVAMREYRAHRDVYDKRDWEIERIYRAISKGKTVINVQSSIVGAGLILGQHNSKLPRLAICQAHALSCSFLGAGDACTFGVTGSDRFGPGTGRIKITFPGVGHSRAVAQVPRIPPQFRPKASLLPCYHILWEADWADIPRDPYLLRRIGKDAWVVVAAWDLTDVEISVIRSHQ